MSSSESWMWPGSEPPEEESEQSEDGRALKLWSDEYEGVKVGLATQMKGEKWPTPFQIAEIWDNPMGGPDLVKLKRRKLMADHSKEVEWYRNQGYEVDDVSDPVSWFITVSIDTIAEKTLK